MRDAGGELDVLEATRHLTHGVTADLAVLAGQVRGDLLAVLFHEVADAEHDLGPPRQGEGSPGGECLVRGAHRGTDLFDAREVDLARDLAGRRVVHVAVTPARAGGGSAPDPVVKTVDRGFGLRRSIGELSHGGAHPFLQDTPGVHRTLGPPMLRRAPWLRRRTPFRTLRQAARCGAGGRAGRRARARDLRWAPT